MRGRNKRIILVGIAAIVILTVFAYRGSIRDHLLEWDDQVYVRENPYIKGITRSHLKAILTQPYFKNFSPLHLLSYCADHALWGENYAGYHLTNLAIHIINGFLLLLLVFLWTHDYWIALFVAAALLIHPVHVESVAWISERKGLLCALFFFGALIAYDRLKKTGVRGWYLAAFLLFSLSILSKPMAITLPLILILLDRTVYREHSSLGDLIPFFILSLFSGLITVWALETGGGIKGYVGGNLAASLLSIPVIILRYISRILWPFPPFRLSARYVLRWNMVAPRAALPAWGMLVLIAFLVFYLHSRLPSGERRITVAGTAWFFITLLPVLNIIPTSTQMADRYLYLPAIGIYVAMGTLLARGIRRLTRVSPAGMISLVVPLIWLACLGVKTRTRVAIWQSDQTLWEDALEEDPKNHYALTNLANVYLHQALDEPDTTRRGEAAEKAGSLFLHALEISPEHASAHLGIASTLVHMGSSQKALPHLSRALLYNTEPLRRVRIYYTAGLAFMHIGRRDEADLWFHKAIEEDRGFKPAYFGLGHLYMSIAQNTEKRDLWLQRAAEVYQEVMRRYPEEFKAYFSLAVVRENEGRPAEALALYRQALDLPASPGEERERADAHINIGIIHQRQGRYSQAMFHYREALRIAPGHSRAQEIERTLEELRKALSAQRPAL
ncbi:MAG: tetratricopeptide repeat protein [bacterium]